MTIFESLEVVITLRCTASCRNCLRFANSTVTTGLDYSGLDMTLDDVGRVRRDIEEVHARTGRRVVDTLCVTGGEPTLHSELLEIWRVLEPLVGGAVGQLVCNVNRTRPVPPEIEPHVVHWWSLAEKRELHQCALVSPSAPPPGFPVQGGRTWATCRHYRRTRIVVTVHGYQLCCAAEGYTRLMGRGELLVGELPDSIAGFPKPDVVCQHCAFGAPIPLFERDHGCPVSSYFDEEAHLNRKGRVLPMKLRDRSVVDALDELQSLIASDISELENGGF